jgi:hypothetical protein
MKHTSISRILRAATPMLIVCVVLALGAAATAQEPIQGSRQERMPESRRVCR